MGLEEAMSPRSCSITWHSFSPWHNLSKLSSAHGLPKELLLVVKVVQVVFYVSTSNHSIFQKNLISLENCDFQRIICLDNFFLLPSHLQILPIEVKAGSQGGMKSLWSFMREKHLTEAIRCSLENFGSFSHTDKEDGDTARHVSVIPLYAVSQIIKITTSDRM